jgi:hypothetical protein
MAKVSAAVFIVRSIENDAPSALAIMFTVPAVAPVTVVVNTPLELAVPVGDAIFTVPVPV